MRALITYSERNEIMDIANTNGITLNGKTAHISGLKNDFATIWNDDCSFEWSWQAVRRIVHNGGEFNT